MHNGVANGASSYNVELDVNVSELIDALGRLDRIGHTSTAKDFRCLDG